MVPRLAPKNHPRSVEFVAKEGGVWYNLQKKGDGFMNDAKQASPAFGGFLILTLKYDPEQAAASFICKRPKLNDGKLSDEESG